MLHGAPPPGDKEAMKEMLKMFHRGFPGIKMRIDDVVAEGDKVVFRLTVQGTHTGDFRGITPTGKKVILTGMQMWRIVNGKIAEGWFIRDDLGLMQQLG